MDNLRMSQAEGLEVPLSFPAWIPAAPVRFGFPTAILGVDNSLCYRPRGGYS